MDRKTAGLLGAVVGLATMGSAQAANVPATNTAEALQASSYADLLSPVQDAVTLMKADDALRAREPAPVTGDVQDANYYYAPGYVPAYHHHHHHHHHHHQAYRHHHHHHHHSAYVGIPGVGVVIGSH